MRLLYPCEPFNLKQPDEQYAEEYNAALAAGLDTLLFSFEALQAGLLETSRALNPGDCMLYRGWMLTPEAYAVLVDLLHGCTAVALTSPEQYRQCHHLPQWYPLLAAHTSETVILPDDADFEQAFAGLQWPGYFIKDYVKSLSTGNGSLVDSPREIAPLVAQMRQYRGQVEGGICVRRRESYLEETERRYFVLDGCAHGADGKVPELVRECAKRIDSPFFSVDTVMRADGVLRLVELGDGQVSDLKEWPTKRFVGLLKSR